RLKSGALGALEQSFALPAGWRTGVDVIAEGVAASWTTRELVLTDSDGTRSVQSQSGDPMALADRAFIDAVASGSPDKVKSSYQDALLTHRVVMAASRSAREGKAVEL